MSRSVKRIEQAIGQAIDEAGEVPDWIYPELGVNESIRDFHERSLKLASLLKSDASDWLQASRFSDAVEPSSAEPYSAEPSSVVTRSRFRLATMMMLATGASLIAIAMVLIPMNIRPHFPTGQGGSLSKGHTDTFGSLSPGGSPQGSSHSAESTSIPEFFALDLQSELVQPSPPAVEDPQLIFFAFESTLNAIELVNSTIADKVMGDPLDRFVHQQLGSRNQVGDSGDDLIADDPVSEKSLELLRELKRTSDFLAQSFPRRTLRSSPDSGF